MQHSQHATGLVQHFEGCVLHAYPDPGSGGDPWTIGWGATGPGIASGIVWTQVEADARLDADLSRVDEDVTRLIGGKPTSQSQFDALTSFTYNLGPHALAESTLLRMHRAGDFAGAAAEFPKWTMAAHHILAGLVARRAAEAALYSTP